MSFLSLKFVKKKKKKGPIEWYKTYTYKLLSLNKCKYLLAV